VRADSDAEVQADNTNANYEHQQPITAPLAVFLQLVSQAVALLHDLEDFPKNFALLLHVLAALLLHCNYTNPQLDMESF
jgi:hypothetical protein